MESLLVAAALLVAFSNGANDNFKGFATVWGSQTLGYRQALALATLATAVGSLVSLTLAGALVKQFSGAGLVPAAVAGTPLFIFGVAVGAATAVLLATRLGLPVSTTHALIGGLIGAGLAQPGGEVHFAKLASAFVLPLLLSPVLAAALGVIVYRLMKFRAAPAECACVVSAVPIPAATATGSMRAEGSTLPALVMATDAECDRLPAHARLSVTRGLDKLHIGSALSICFARAVNDTPKLTALLMAAQLANVHVSVALIAAAVLLGGLLFSQRVADTMSRRVTHMDHAQGLAANLITAALVLFASKFGLPVSTTHVSVGAIGGVGASAGTLDRRALRNILLSWIATLPVAGLAAWLIAVLA